jgi:hydrogenase maturation protein HypF
MRPSAPIRHVLRVRGIVQGVGFRPAVYRLARAQGLSGWVRNDADGVWIEVEGPEDTVQGFPALLRQEAPPLSRIDRIDVSPMTPVHVSGFSILTSGSAREGEAAIPPDVATCEACLRELADPTDRRYRYPFINCTDCGPRYTIVRGVPYDRARTTMSSFPLCSDCRREYEDPGNRRFHAEPNACPACGPRLELLRPGEAPHFAEDALRSALEALAAGRVVAVKGLGGFFLAVDATNEAAVATLRTRKRRPRKPFALMARGLGEVRRLAELDDVECAALSSPARPIVLLAARKGNGVAPSVAHGLSELGVMLPYTPLHHLLLEGRAPVLVMTSGNAAEEPLARDHAEALTRLVGVADVFLVHDRDIHARVDDSVLRVQAGRPQLVRRARGYVPAALALPFESPPVLAVGAELKNTVCLTRGRHAYLSSHVGDLQNAQTHAFFLEVITGLERLLAVEPAVVAHDLHPDYLSTRWARARGLPTVAVQHHHAHVAACLAEHGRMEPVIGVAFDGTGCGPAGDLWGGEVLLADLAGFRRLAHLRPLSLPGGEAAIREPWRLAGAALLDAGEPLDCLADLDPRRLGWVRELVARPSLCPRATGAGRWFDAVAALCGVCRDVTYEGQAAIELEAAAAPGGCEPYPFAWEPGSGEPHVIDLRPTVRGVAADLRTGGPGAVVAARFHETLSRAVHRACVDARDAHGVTTVALSGGCFQNRRLTGRTRELLAAAGFEVLLHGQVPPNDGGVALGQAAIAAFRSRLQEEDGHVPRHPR